MRFHILLFMTSDFVAQQTSCLQETLTVAKLLECQLQEQNVYAFHSKTQNVRRCLVVD